MSLATGSDRWLEKSLISMARSALSSSLSDLTP
jgi:hypothetical protein